LILAGDIGGTKTNLGLFDVQGKELKLIEERSFPSKNYTDLQSILDVFLAGQNKQIQSACFGIACPMSNGYCETTNLPWVVDTRELKRKLNVDVGLINDVEATAYGVLALRKDSFATLNEGHAEPQGTIGIIAAGTGLGEAALVWTGQAYRALASEGGHADFSPRNELELELCRSLFSDHDHVSYERVLSGPGLFTIYKFLKEDKDRVEPEWLAQRLAKEDPSAVVSEAGLEGKSDLCTEALDLFASFYGAEAGNLALKFMAKGGIYLGGGIAPKILKKLKDGTFMKAFLNKGRLSSTLLSIPVHVILEQKTALYGAAHYGRIGVHEPIMR